MAAIALKEYVSMANGETPLCLKGWVWCAWLSSILTQSGNSTQAFTRPLTQNTSRRLLIFWFQIPNGSISKIWDNDNEIVIYEICFKHSTLQRLANLLAVKDSTAHRCTWQLSSCTHALAMCGRGCTMCSRLGDVHSCIRWGALMHLLLS